MTGICGFWSYAFSMLYSSMFKFKYSSFSGDRRIRVHTLCLPVISNLSEIHSRVDVQAVVSLISKLGMLLMNSFVIIFTG